MQKHAVAHEGGSHSCTRDTAIRSSLGDNMVCQKIMLDATMSPKPSQREGYRER